MPNDFSLDGMYKLAELVGCSPIFLPKELSFQGALTRRNGRSQISSTIDLAPFFGFRTPSGEFFEEQPGSSCD